VAGLYGRRGVRSPSHGCRWSGIAWWKKDTDWSDVSSLEQPQLSAQDTNIYDMCLVQNAGNKVTCDALMRLIDRERQTDAYTENEIKKMLAAGASQCEVVKWALDRNFNGTKLHDALGISAKQFHDFYQENFIKPIIANRGVVPDRVECRARQIKLMAGFGGAWAGCLFLRMELPPRPRSPPRRAPITRNRNAFADAPPENQPQPRRRSDPDERLSHYG
jgi:hypothetical protein